MFQLQAYAACDDEVIREHVSAAYERLGPHVRAITGIDRGRAQRVPQPRHVAERPGGDRTAPTWRPPATGSSGVHGADRGCRLAVGDASQPVAGGGAADRRREPAPDGGGGATGPQPDPAHDRAQLGRRRAADRRAGASASGSSRWPSPRLIRRFSMGPLLSLTLLAVLAGCARAAGSVACCRCSWARCCSVRASPSATC